VTLSRRVLLGTVAAATVLPALRSRAQQEPIRIGVLNDQRGLYRDFGGPTSVLAARMAVEDFGGNVFGRPIEVIDADHQNKATSPRRSRAVGSTGKASPRWPISPIPRRRSQCSSLRASAARSRC
jgi:hypothetical protein